MFISALKHGLNLFVSLLLLVHKEGGDGMEEYVGESVFFPII